VYSTISWGHLRCASSVAEDTAQLRETKYELGLAIYEERDDGPGMIPHVKGSRLPNGDRDDSGIQL